MAQKGTTLEPPGNMKALQPSPMRVSQHVRTGSSCKTVPEPPRDPTKLAIKACYLGLVSIALSSWGRDMSVCVVAANNIHQGSCALDFGMKAILLGTLGVGWERSNSRSDP